MLDVIRKLVERYEAAREAARHASPKQWPDAEAARREAEKALVERLARGNLSVVVNARRYSVEGTALRRGPWNGATPTHRECNE